MARGERRQRNGRASKNDTRCRPKWKERRKIQNKNVHQNNNNKQTDKQVKIRLLLDYYTTAMTDSTKACCFRQRRLKDKDISQELSTGNATLP